MIAFWFGGLVLPSPEKKKEKPPKTLAYTATADTVKDNRGEEPMSKTRKQLKKQIKLQQEENQKLANETEKLLDRIDEIKYDNWRQIEQLEPAIAELTKTLQYRNQDISILERRIKKLAMENEALKAQLKAHSEANRDYDPLGEGVLRKENQELKKQLEKLEGERTYLKKDISYLWNINQELGKENRLLQDDYEEPSDECSCGECDYDQNIILGEN